MFARAKQHANNMNVQICPCPAQGNGFGTVWSQQHHVLVFSLDTSCFRLAGREVNTVVYISGIYRGGYTVPNICFECLEWFLIDVALWPFKQVISLL